jgi:hypothetical protein
MAESYWEEHGEVLVMLPPQHRMKFAVDARALQRGMYYKVCLDADGYAQDMVWGDTGLTIYISPLVGLWPDVVHAKGGGLQSFLEVTCEVGICSNTSTAYLATACDSALWDGRIPHEAPDTVIPIAKDGYATVAKPLYRQGPRSFKVGFLTENLVPGIHFALCFDMDGPGRAKAVGHVATVYMTGATATATRAVQVAPNQLINLTCTWGACGNAGEAFLALDCTTLHGGYYRGMALPRQGPWLSTDSSTDRLPLGDSAQTNIFEPPLVRSSTSTEIFAAPNQNITVRCYEDYYNPVLDPKSSQPKPFSH